MAWGTSDSWVAIDFETASARGTPCAVGLAEILAIVDGRTVVAHNASFDLGVIRDACNETECAWPSKATWRRARSN
jgi:DNA polymerase III alpha subunit (gram-positive type)